MAQCGTRKFNSCFPAIRNLNNPVESQFNKCWPKPDKNSVCRELERCIKEQEENCPASQHQRPRSAPPCLPQGKVKEQRYKDACCSTDPCDSYPSPCGQHVATSTYPASCGQHAATSTYPASCGHPAATCATSGGPVPQRCLDLTVHGRSMSPPNCRKMWLQQCQRPPETPSSSSCSSSEHSESSECDDEEDVPPTKPKPKPKMPLPEALKPTGSENLRRTEEITELPPPRSMPPPRPPKPVRPPPPKVEPVPSQEFTVTEPDEPIEAVPEITESNLTIIIEDETPEGIEDIDIEVETTLENPDTVHNIVVENPPETTVEVSTPTPGTSKVTASIPLPPPPPPPEEEEEEEEEPPTESEVPAIEDEPEVEEEEPEVEEEEEIPPPALPAPEIPPVTLPPEPPPPVIPPPVIPPPPNPLPLMPPPPILPQAIPLPPIPPPMMLPQAIPLPALPAPVIPEIANISPPTTPPPTPSEPPDPCPRPEMDDVATETVPIRSNNVTTATTEEPCSEEDERIMKQLRKKHTCFLCKEILFHTVRMDGCRHYFCRYCLLKYIQYKQNCPECGKKYKGFTLKPEVDACLDCKFAQLCKKYQKQRENLIASRYFAERELWRAHAEANGIKQNDSDCNPDRSKINDPETAVQPYDCGLKYNKMQYLTFGAEAKSKGGQFYKMPNQCQAKSNSGRYGGNCFTCGKPAFYVPFGSTAPRFDDMDYQQQQQPNLMYPPNPYPYPPEIKTSKRRPKAGLNSKLKNFVSDGTEFSDFPGSDKFKMKSKVKKRPTTECFASTSSFSARPFPPMATQMTFDQYDPLIPSCGYYQPKPKPQKTKTPRKTAENCRPCPEPPPRNTCESPHRPPTCLPQCQPPPTRGQTSQLGCLPPTRGQTRGQTPTRGQTAQLGCQPPPIGCYPPQQLSSDFCRCPWGPTTTAKKAPRGMTVGQYRHAPTQYLPMAYSPFHHHPMIQKYDPHKYAFKPNAPGPLHLHMHYSSDRVGGGPCQRPRKVRPICREKPKVYGAAAFEQYDLNYQLR